MPETSRQKLPEPLWCVVCKDRPRSPDSLTCALTHCVEIQEDRDLTRSASCALGVLVLVSFLAGSSFVVLYQWLRG